MMDVEKPVSYRAAWTWTLQEAKAYFQATRESYAGAVITVKTRI